MKLQGGWPKVYQLVYNYELPFLDGGLHAQTLDAKILNAELQTQKDQQRKYDGLDKLSD